MRPAAGPRKRGGRDLRLLSTSGRGLSNAKSGRGAPDARKRMQYLAVIGTAFVITFLAELPDKSMFASLVLGTRYRPSWVWAGAAAAFTVQIGLAVTAGQLLHLLPGQAVEAVTAGLFVAGSAYLWVSSFRPQ